MYKRQLKGLEESVNVIIPGLQGQLDELVLVLVEELNGLHCQGYGLDGGTGRRFFAGIELSLIHI